MKRRVGFVVCVVLAPFAACSSVGADPTGDGGAGGFAVSGSGAGGSIGGAAPLPCGGVAGAIAAPVMFREPSGNACSGTPMKMPRVGTNMGAATAADGRIYLVGGFSLSAGNTNPACSTPRLIVYDPTTNAYKPLAEPPEQLSLGPTGATIVGETLFVVAGRFLRYDIPTDTWSVPSQMGNAGTWLYGDPLPGPNGSVYLFGADGGVGAYEYQPSTNRYQALPRMPDELFYPSTATVGGKYYAIGSYGSAVFDPQAQTWQPITGPTYRSGASLVPDGAGHLLLIGGESTVIESMVQSYDPATDVWTMAPALPVGVVSPAVATGCGGRVFVLGGQNRDYAHYPTGQTDLVQVYSFGAWTLSP